MQVGNLFRYPVKGLSAEPMREATLTPGQAIPWDRAFALAQGDAPFDPAAPAFLPKSNFMCLMRNGRIATLRAHFAADPPWLTITAPDATTIAADPTTPEGRAILGPFLTAFLGTEARGTPLFQHAPGHSFGDQRAPVVSLLNRASLRAFEADQGAMREEARFRANILFDTLPAWEEFEWVGRRLRIGTAVLEVTKRTVRCAAVEVNPATGIRDADPIGELRRLYGHADLGIHAAVIQGGRIAPGDAIELV